MTCCVFAVNCLTVLSCLPQISFQTSHTKELPGVLGLLAKARSCNQCHIGYMLLAVTSYMQITCMTELLGSCVMNMNDWRLTRQSGYFLLVRCQSVALDRFTHLRSLVGQYY
jgi:hypothetical protein